MGKKIVILVFLTLLLSLVGCAKNFSKNAKYAASVEKQYYFRDSARCEMFAQKLITQQAISATPYPSETNTKISNKGLEISKNAKYSNEIILASELVNTSGAIIDVQMRKATNYNACMRYLGWCTAEEFTQEMYAQQSKNNIIHDRISLLKQDMLYDDVIQYMKANLDKLPPGEKEITGKRILSSIDAFEDTYYKVRPKVEAIRKKDPFSAIQ